MYINNRAVLVYYFLPTLFMFLLTACGGGSGSGNDASDSQAQPQSQSLEESLSRLGVDTEPSPRLNSQGDPYPDEYAPLGQVMTIRQIDPTEDEMMAGITEPEYFDGRPEELFLGALRLDGRQGFFSVLDTISIAGLTELEATFTIPDVLEARPVVEVPWATEIDDNLGSIRPPLGTRRDTAAMDANGDGFLGSVTAYATDESGMDIVRLQFIDGEPATPILDFPLLSGGRFLPAGDIQVAAGDYDGDGRDELAIAIARVPESGMSTTPVGVYLVEDASAGFFVEDQFEVQYKASFAEGSVMVALTQFHADHDDRHELALIVNETNPTLALPGDYSTQLFIMGFSDGMIGPLARREIRAEVRDSAGTPRQANAVRASLAVGDLDGDTADELLVGGFEQIVENCTDQDGANDPIEYLLIAYGGRNNDFSPISAGATEVFPPCDFESGSEPFIMRHVHMNVLDFDADDDLDLQFNDLVLENVPGRNWEDQTIALLDDQRVIYNSGERLRFDRSDSVMALSDQTGDGVKDILTVFMDVNENDPYIKVYSWDEEAENGYRLATRIMIEADDQQNENPILVPIDVDNDKVAQLRYNGEHFTDITEPIVLAAIATPPCRQDIGQDGCFSSWGNTLSGAVGDEHSVRVFGSAGAGMGAAGAGALGKWLISVSASAALVTSESYELSQSQTFNAGPGEDAVIFTSIPVDRYEYEIIKNTTDDLGVVGDLLEIRLPRSPSIRIVERGYFNRSITAGAEPIDERVFEHVPGDIDTYPTEVQKDVILETRRTVLEEARTAEAQAGDSQFGFGLLDALLGPEVGPVLVGEGRGSTNLSLEYSESSGVAGALTAGVSFEAEMLFGAAIRWEVGIERGRTLSIIHGNSTLYSGTVSSISERFYEDNVYGFGLFTYLQRLGGQEIEVMNYWVEE